MSQRLSSDRQQQPPQYEDQKHDINWGVGDVPMPLVPNQAVLQTLTARRLKVTLIILGRSMTQLCIAVLLFLWMSYNNYCLLSESSKKILLENPEQWSPRELIMAETLLKKIFLEAFTGTILVSRGLRDYLFAEVASKVVPGSSYARAFWRNVIYMGLGILILAVGVWDTIALEGVLPWRNLITFAMVQSCCALYLSSTIRDRDDAAEVRVMLVDDSQKYQIALATLKRSNVQLGISGVLCLWVTVLNYRLFAEQAPSKLGLTASEILLGRAFLGLLFLCVSVGAPMLMSSGLRDYGYGAAVSQSFPGSVHAHGGRNLRYFFGGVAMLVGGLGFFYWVQAVLPYTNVLVYLSVQALVFLIFLTSLRDRIDAERIEVEGAPRAPADAAAHSD